MTDFSSTSRRDDHPLYGMVNVLDDDEVSEVHERAAEFRRVDSARVTPY